MRMGLPRPSRIFLVFLALVAVSTVTSAQSPSVLGPRKLISDSGQPLPDNALLLPLNGQQASNNRLDGLLVLSGLRSRQQQVTCTTNYTACQGTDFCCPNGNMCCSGGVCCGAGTYCTIVGGVQGCCRLGHICNQVTNECTVAGQQRCPNENFCCATGDTCSRDANNNPRCSSGGTPTLPTPTSQTSLSSSKPGQSGTPATAVSTSTGTSLPTLCRLKATGSRGLLRRRRQPGVHPAAKRRSWF